MCHSAGAVNGRCLSITAKSLVVTTTCGWFAFLSLGSTGVRTKEILTWPRAPLACHVHRGVRCGRDQLNRRGRHSYHLPRSHLARSRSESRKWDQHRRALARVVWRTLRLSSRTRKQFTDSDSAWSNEHHRRRARRVAAHPHALAGVCETGPVFNPVRDAAVHVEQFDQ